MKDLIYSNLFAYQIFLGAIVGITSGRLLAAFHIHNPMLAFIVGGIAVIPFALLLQMWVSPSK